MRIKAGLATEPTLPQSLFRLGGLNTVRGFEYGTLRGSALWSAQLDIAPLDGRVRPVVFLDAGQTAPVSDLLSSKALVGGGVGVSFFHGIIRFDLSRPISPDISGKLRFDIVLRGVR
jgi:hemolysin activation/secretion protein